MLKHKDYNTSFERVNDHKVRFTVEHNRGGETREFVVAISKDGLHISANDQIIVYPKSAVDIEVDYR